MMQCLINPVGILVCRGKCFECNPSRSEYIFRANAFFLILTLFFIEQYTVNSPLSLSRIFNQIRNISSQE